MSWFSKKGPKEPNLSISNVGRSWCQFLFRLKDSIIFSRQFKWNLVMDAKSKQDCEKKGKTTGRLRSLSLRPHLLCSLQLSSKLEEKKNHRKLFSFPQTLKSFAFVDLSSLAPLFWIKINLSFTSF